MKAPKAWRLGNPGSDRFFQRKTADLFFFVVVVLCVFFYPGSRQPAFFCCLFLCCFFGCFLNHGGLNLLDDDFLPLRK